MDKNICKFTLNDGVNIEGGEGDVIIEPDPMLVYARKGGSLLSAKL